MLLSIGRRERAAELVDLLLACHERIRTFSRLAREIAAAAAAPDAEVGEACASCERYFAEALPLHVRDEEDSLAPRLRGRRAEVDRALSLMEQQHGSHAAPLEALLGALRAVRASPREPALRERLASCAAELERDFAEHLELEESVLFPAVRELLSADERRTIESELRARRAPDPPG
jgi:iron-sulfur cluster repair protein YtfE (RIC family)